jgi:hypothetical protein
LGHRRPPVSLRASPTLGWRCARRARGTPRPHARRRGTSEAIGGQEIVRGALRFLAARNEVLLAEDPVPGHPRSCPGQGVGGAADRQVLGSARAADGTTCALGPRRRGCCPARIDRADRPRRSSTRSCVIGSRRSLQRRRGCGAGGQPDAGARRDQQPGEHQLAGCVPERIDQQVEPVRGPGGGPPASAMEPGA